MKFKLIENNNRSFKIYNNGEKDIRIYNGDTIPDGFVLGTHYKKVPWNKGLTAETDERVKNNTDRCHLTRKENGTYDKAWNSGLTKETDERIASYAQKLAGENNPMYGTHPIPWNKGLTGDERCKGGKPGEHSWNYGLTMETDDRIKTHEVSLETRDHLRTIHLSPEFKALRYEIMKANGTFGILSDSKAELNYLDKLKQQYSEDDIIHPYIDKNRYPFLCDFYIKSEDLFIEVHANWTHGGKPYDQNDPECLLKLALWREKAKTSDYYKNAIYTWTDLDVRKYQTAIKNNLNFKAVYYKY